MKSRYVVLLVSLGIFLSLSLFVGMFALLNGAMKGPAYQQSLENVRSSTALRNQLGTPMEPGYFVLGSISTSGGSGKADLTYTVTGPNGSAKIYVLANKELGAWRITQQVAEPRNASERVPLVVDGVAHE